MLVCVGKGKAVLGGGQIFADFLPEVVATPASICDKSLTRRQIRVAKEHKSDLMPLQKMAFLARNGGSPRECIVYSLLRSPFEGDLLRRDTLPWGTPGDGRRRPAT